MPRRVKRKRLVFVSHDRLRKRVRNMKKRRILISHAQTDREWVRAFAEALTAQGVEVWLDELQLQAGDRWEQAMEQGFRASDVIAFVITADNVHGPNLLFELGAAMGLGKRGCADSRAGRADFRVALSTPCSSILAEGVARRNGKKAARGDGGVIGKPSSQWTGWRLRVQVRLVRTRRPLAKQCDASPFAFVIADGQRQRHLAADLTFAPACCLATTLALSPLRLFSCFVPCRQQGRTRLLSGLSQQRMFLLPPLHPPRLHTTGTIAHLMRSHRCQHDLYQHRRLHTSRLDTLPFATKCLQRLQRRRHAQLPRRLSRFPSRCCHQATDQIISQPMRPTIPYAPSPESYSSTPPSSSFV